MNSHQEEINRLNNKLAALSIKQEQFLLEIRNLRQEIEKLSAAPSVVTEAATTDKQEVTPTAIPAQKVQKTAPVRPWPTAKETAGSTPKLKFPEFRSDMEKFIGENLINKIGIIITIFGVAIGVKYSIENNLISPLTRVILGYLAGIALLGFGIKLKKNFENYSAVLISGAMTIMYFITYAAFDFYGLIPQVLTFALMVIFTIFTVIASLNYNKQVIAHIGLTGAYAIPFLLSDGSGNTLVLFSYMTIINTGILIIAFKKYWKPLYYSAFSLTWIIYLAWYASGYKTEEDFATALVFATLFFSIFYLTFIAYKSIPKKKFEAGDIILLLANSFIFYGVGYSILSDHPNGKYLLGLFTLCNAAIHFAAGMVIYKKQLADKNLLYLITGLVLVFITLAIPVQLDGTWVSTLWAAEAALLFWIGRSKNEAFFERLSFILMIIALFSIIQDWALLYGNYSSFNPEARIIPVFNTNFLSSVLCIGAFTLINYMNSRYPETQAWKEESRTAKLVKFTIPAMLVLLIYYAFRMEISNYWLQLYTDSEIAIDNDSQTHMRHYWNEDLLKFKKIAIINYSLLFTALLTWVNMKKIRSGKLGFIVTLLTGFALIVFLTQGLLVLSELRESYLDQTLTDYYNRGAFNIIVRYISLLIAGLTVLTTFFQLRQEYTNNRYRKPFDLVFHITMIWILSSELIHWMDMADSSQSYKLGISILWGVYSLHLIARGIWKKKKHLRLMAIVLFGITLVKLFLYDIAHLNTISKTIVFVSLGVLLLIISFLYNKYKLVISDE